jgi:hypothetical protein
MNVSLKQLAVYLGLVVIGSGGGVFVSRYFWTHNLSFQELKNVAVTLPAESAAPQPVNGILNTSGSDNINFIATAVGRVGPAVVRKYQIR